MTHQFTEGEKVPDHYDVGAVAPRTGSVLHGPEGSDLLFRIDHPTRDEIQAFESGPVALGVRDGEGGAAFLLDVGVPGEPGAVEEAVVEGRTMVSVNMAWWGEDIELALVDQAGVCRKRRPFRGPVEGLLPGDAPFDALSTPRVAVFEDRGYGLTQPHGPLTVDVVVSGGYALASLPGWCPGLDEVWDLRFVTDVHIAPSRVVDLLSVEEGTLEALRGTRTVFVLPDSPRPALAAASNFYRAVAESVGRTISVCRTPAEAASELGVDRIPTLDPPTGVAGGTVPQPDLV